jgi:hypothetical protein
MNLSPAGATNGADPCSMGVPSQMTWLSGCFDYLSEKPWRMVVAFIVHTSIVVSVLYAALP